MLCLGMHSNVMLRFMLQAFQDPPLCSITKLCAWDTKLNISLNGEIHLGGMLQRKGYGLAIFLEGGGGGIFFVSCPQSRHYLSPCLPIYEETTGGFIKDEYCS
jgi:hypothetical protein